MKSLHIIGFTEEELRETVQEAYEAALDNAALEAFEGRYSKSELAEMVDEEKIRKEKGSEDEKKLFLEL